MASQSISYLSVVWVLYSPLFPMIALPRRQVDRECLGSWSVHLWADIGNIFSITAVWDRNACQSQASSYYHAHRSGFPSHRRLLAHWPAEPSPRLSHTLHATRTSTTRPTTLALQERVAASIRKTWGVHTGRVLAFKISDGTVNAEIWRGIVKSKTIFNLPRVLKRNATGARRNACSEREDLVVFKNSCERGSFSSWTIYNSIRRVNT